MGPLAEVGQRQRDVWLSLNNGPITNIAASPRCANNRNGRAIRSPRWRSRGASWERQAERFGGLEVYVDSVACSIDSVRRMLHPRMRSTVLAARRHIARTLGDGGRRVDAGSGDGKNFSDDEAVSVEIITIVSVSGLRAAHHRSVCRRSCPQFLERSDIQLLHDVSAVHLDCLLADLERTGDALAAFTG